MRTQAWDDVHLILTRDFILITLVNFVLMVADYQYFVTTAFFAMELFDASMSTAGFTAGMFVLGCLLARFFIGFLLTTLGLNPCLCLSLLGCSVLAALGFFADTLLLYVAQRFCFGFFIGALGTTTATIVAYSVPAHLQGLGVSLFSLSTALALALGPFIGITVQQQWGYTALNSEITFLCAVSFILSLFTAKFKGAKRQVGSWFKLSNYIEQATFKIGLIGYIVPLGYSCVTAYLASLCLERGMAQAAGLFFLVAATMTVLTRPFAGRMFDVLGENAVIYPAIALAALALIILAWAPSTPWVLVAGFIHGIGFGNFQSSGQALALKVAPRSRFAQSTSTFFMCWDLSLGTAPYIFGFVAAQWGFTTTFGLLFVIVLSALPLYYLLYGRHHPLKKSWRRATRQHSA